MKKQMNAQLEELMPIMKLQIENGQSVRFSPQGVSMLPMLRQGVDSVVISKAPEQLKKYDLPLYQRENGQYVLHRIVETGDTYTCMGDNQFVKEYGVRQDQIIAVVTAFYRDERKYKTEDLRYQMYCRLWYHSRHFRHLWNRGWRWVRRKGSAVYTIICGQHGRR